ALEQAEIVGASETIMADDVSVPTRVQALTDGGADVSVDALGSAATCRECIQSLRPRGTHLQVGLTGEEERGEISIPTDLMARWEQSLVGSRGMPPTRYDELLRMVETDHLDPEQLINREVSLEEVPHRLSAMTTFDGDIFTTRGHPCSPSHAPSSTEDPWPARSSSNDQSVAARSALKSNTPVP
ncbi:MAG: zinc-binding dehydrogenase, partial [Halobacteriaceae archaeon]